ncbi:hypothetical protein GPECTOR_56g435 [Gonium pectorale]|uniref:separase n=1 Tax=Gonium pectorale TaxID=33097 RepID=A0A150G689_GONPE|nr:hypothetical protein GPECTOR_56g435 [Gonium pectorale]|eukprot:KXZ45338.1 hypothetical protein GPECTOR_56g435 [Gonium pectorale]
MSVLKCLSKMLVDDLTGSSEAVEQGILEALLWQLDAHGSLPDALCSLLHKTALGLIQQKAKLQPRTGNNTGHPAAKVVRAALRLTHYQPAERGDMQLAEILAPLAGARSALADSREVQTPLGSGRLRWCCLDALRAAVSGVLGHLASSPQSAGGELIAGAQCMELFAEESLRLLESREEAATTVLPSACSAVAIAVRLTAVHRFYTGRLAGLSDDMSRSMGLLHRLFQQPPAVSSGNPSSAVGPAVLQSLSASLGNTGLDLLQGQHVASAVELLRTAADLAVQRARQLADNGAVSAVAELLQLVKKCKAHVMALQQLSDHAGAMAAVATYVANLHEFIDGNPQHVSPLTKLFVRSSMDAFIAEGAKAVAVKLRDTDVYTLCTTMPARTCLGWTLVAQPSEPLAAAACTPVQHAKLAELLKLTKAMRDANSFDHVAVATAASSCAMDLERSGFLRHGPAPLLLRSQCHQAAAAAYLRAGDTANAYAHAQEALRITCSLLSLINAPALLGDERSGSASAEPSLGRELTPAEAAAAAVQEGAVTSAQDYAAQHLGGCGSASSVCVVGLGVAEPVAISLASVMSGDHDGHPHADQASKKAHQVLVGRAVRGSVPLVVLLSRQRDGSAGGDDAKSSTGKAASSAEVLGGCVQRLRSLLEESGDSMRLDQDAQSSQSLKAKWWKTRTSLDQSVKALLQDLDQKCLGPWRCLLQPVASRHRPVLLAAAETFAQEHLQPPEAASAEGRERILAIAKEAVFLALSSMQHLPSADVAAILTALRSQTGQPHDADRIQALAEELVASEATARVQLLSIPDADRDSAEGADASKAAALAEAPERGKRVSRLAAMKPEASSSSTAVPRPARGAVASAARGAPRCRPLAAAAAVAAPVKQAQQPSPAASGDGHPSSPLAEEMGGAASAPASSACGAPHGNGEHVLLALSPALHALPWESIPSLLGRDVYRILSLPVACASASALSSATAVDGLARMAVGATGSKGAGPAPVPSAYYLLNPSGDLFDTQQSFQAMLESQPSWQGVTGQKPSARALLAALQSHDIFLYLGHGSGEQFLPSPALRKLQRCAACVLMGCSSGRLRLHGAYDPSGAAVAYLLAGCPALVANLWDVTDRDIDRYCQALLDAWLGCGPGLTAGDAETAGGGPSGGQGREDKADGPSCRREALGLAVSRSRAACKLPHLVGAAPVTYGLPLQMRGGGQLAWPL